MMRRVLIVEDSPVSRAVLREMLEARGHRVVAEAESEAQALAAYRAHRPDLVTLDLSLSSDSGLVILDALRKLDGNANVLVISGNPQKNIIARAMAAGAIGFLTKPIDRRDLESVISRLVVQ